MDTKAAFLYNLIWDSCSVTKTFVLFRQRFRSMLYTLERAHSKRNAVCSTKKNRGDDVSPRKP